MRWACILLTIGVAAGCRNDMYDQPRYKPLSGGSNLLGSSSARDMPEGTVAYEENRELTAFDTGTQDGKLADRLPFQFDRLVLERGRERYVIFCTPCHGAIGDGQGIVVKRGFTPPPSFHSDDLRKAPLGHFFDVITNGHGAMYSFAARVETKDRWCIASYIRALQLSQHADTRQLSAEDRQKLAETPR